MPLLKLAALLYRSRLEVKWTCRVAIAGMSGEALNIITATASPRPYPSAAASKVLQRPTGDSACNDEHTDVLLNTLPI